MAQRVKNLTSIHEDAGSLASFSKLRILCCHELWHRLAAAPPTTPLAWELPYTTGVPLKGKKKKKRKFRWNQTAFIGLEGRIGSQIYVINSRKILNEHTGSH